MKQVSELPSSHQCPQYEQELIYQRKYASEMYWLSKNIELESMGEVGGATTFLKPCFGTKWTILLDVFVLMIKSQK